MSLFTVCVNMGFKGQPNIKYGSQIFVLAHNFHLFPKDHCRCGNVLFFLKLMSISFVFETFILKKEDSHQSVKSLTTG